MEQANAVLAVFCSDYNQRFARPPPTRLAISALSPAASISPAVLAFATRASSVADHVVTLGAATIALPPRPGLRSYAGVTVELSHQLDGSRSSSHSRETDFLGS